MNMPSFIEDYQNRGGYIRSFDRSDRADIEALKHFLAERGYHLSRTMRGAMWLITSSSVPKPKPRTRSQVIAFTDSIRAKEGKETFRARARS